jgi:hypothetical protein
MTHRPRTVRARTRLTVQAFEPRDCPACTVVQAGTTLYVLGDNTANTVVISDSGPSRGQTGLTPAELDITADGQTTDIPNSTISRVVVQTLGGDDSVTYAPGVPNGTQAIGALVLDLGSGNDSVDATVSRPFFFDLNSQQHCPALNLRVAAGVGDDAVVVRTQVIDEVGVFVRASLGAGDDTFAGLVGDQLVNELTAPRTLLFAVQGGAGDDSIAVSAAGIQAGNYTIAAALQGGAGDDDISATVSLLSGPATVVRLSLAGGDGDDGLTASDTNPTSTLAGTAIQDQVVLSGGNGDDDLAVDMTTNHPHVVGLISGDAGFDTAAVPGGNVSVTIKTCEFTA